MADEELSRLRIDKGSLPTRRRKRKLVLLILLLAALMAGLWWLHQRQLLTPAIAVQVYHVQPLYPAQTFTRLNASGYVVAQRKSALAAKITGQLVELTVEEGSHVYNGQVIARLENRDALAARKRAEANLHLARSNLTQAQAELRDAQLDYERRRQLVERAIIPRAQFDTAEARYHSTLAMVAARQAAVRAAAAAVAETQVAIDYSYIEAPFDGVVLTKNADIGDIVTPLGAAANAKSAVVTIADMSSLQVEVDVSEANIGLVSVGQPCEIQLDALPEQRFAGRVYMIVPTADRSKASVMVKVTFDELDPRVLPEMSAKVAFLERAIEPAEKEPVLAVPVTALQAAGGRQAIFVVRGRTAEAVTVQTGRTFGDMREIHQGISPEDRVVTSPPANLRHGARIKLME